MFTAVALMGLSIPIIPSESPFTMEFETSHDFLPISHYFCQLWIQTLAFFVFWGLASLYIGILVCATVKGMVFYSGIR